MYSMVLMAALTTGTDMPDWGRRWGCCGCYGGWGGCYGGYGGYGYGGWGRGGWGGWGGGYGGWGGGYGGWGGGWGGWGGGWGGGLGGWGYVAAPVVPAYVGPSVLVSNTLPAAAPATRSMYYNPNTASSNRATIIVHLPESAKLTVDGKPTTSTSNTRRFYSPPLERGKSYHYTFTARMEREGKTVTADQRVEVQAGDRREISISLSEFDQIPEDRPSDTPDRRKSIPDQR